MLSQIISAKDLSSLQHAFDQDPDSHIAQEHPSPPSDIHNDHGQRKHLPLHMENRLDRMESLLERMVGETDGSHLSPVLLDSSPQNHSNMAEAIRQNDSPLRDVPLDPALFGVDQDAVEEQTLGNQAQTHGFGGSVNASGLAKEDQIDPSLLYAANASSALQVELSMDPALA